MDDRIYDIELKLNDIRQLFNSLDPAPFLERELDDDAVEYIVGSVKEHHYERKMRIIIYLPEEKARKISALDTQKAIAHHFTYQLDLLRRKLNNLLNEGRNAFVAGISFLIICLSLSEFLHLFVKDWLIAKILSEGLMIAGWVGLWKPISIFLYDWWPIESEKKIFQKIRDMELKVISIPNKPKIS